MKDLTITSMLCLAMLTLVSCGGDEATPQGSGFIEATEVVISAVVTGTLEHLYFGEGERVTAGATLALVDTTTYALQLAEAMAQKQAAKTRETSARLQVEKAELDSSLAEKEFLRISEILDKGSANRQQYDQAETRYHQAALVSEMARAALRAASADLVRIKANVDILHSHLAAGKIELELVLCVGQQLVVRVEWQRPGDSVRVVCHVVSVGDNPRVKTAYLEVPAIDGP